MADDAVTTIELDGAVVGAYVRGRMAVLEVVLRGEGSPAVTLEMSAEKAGVLGEGLIRAAAEAGEARRVGVAAATT